MLKTGIRIGPRDHGRRMSLADFDRAEGQEGYRYELSRGVVLVLDIPGPWHLAQVDALRRQLYAHQAGHPGHIACIGGAGECKFLIGVLESERHPDVAVYKTRARHVKNVWAEWVPEIVVEVVAPDSEERDYIEKREEYPAFGMREYWILDADKQEMLVLRRSRGRWTERVVRPPEVYRTRLLPDLEFRCADVFAAAEATGR